MTSAKMVKISDFCQTGSGTTPSRQKMDRYYGGSIPWVKSGELRESIINHTEESVTAAALSETSLKLVPSGAILVAMYGATVGRVGRLGVDATTNQAICHIVPDHSVADDQYMFHALCAKANELIAKGVGGAQPNISQGTIKDTQIFLPTLAEQKRIAAILDLADDLRRKRKCAIDRLNQLGQAIFHEMFGEWDRPNVKVKTIQLGEHLDFLTSGSRGWAEHYSDSGGLFLRIQNVRRDELDLSDVAFVNAPVTAEANRTRVQPGDVLLSITADLGRTAVVPEDIGEAYINQHLAIIRAKRFNSRFLSAALSSPSGQRLILKRNREGVKAGLNFEDIRSVLLPDVNRELEELYCERVKVIDTLKRLKREALSEANMLFDTLQYRAFRGEL